LINTNAIVLASTLGVAAIAGIAVAIVVVVGLAGGSGYAVAMKNTGDGMVSTQNNPLYTECGSTAYNPLNKNC